MTVRPYFTCFWLRRAPAVCALMLAAAHASAAPAASQSREGCETGWISEVAVSNHSVFDLTDPSIAGGRFEWAFRIANALHVRTDPEVIERELLFKAGDCYELDVLRDSERMLRRFRFLTDAEITPVRLSDDSVRVEVDTRDEWSTRIQPTVRSESSVELTGIRLVEDNILGTGQRGALFYEREDGEQVYGIGYAAPQLFGTRTDIALELADTDVGTSYREVLAYPFVGETGRYGFRQVIDRRDRYFELFRPREGGDLLRIWQPVRREEFEVGAALRRGGQRYRHTLFGVAVAAERVAFPGDPLYADSAGTPDVAPGFFENPWVPFSTTRLVGLLGRRDVEFVRRRGFDTVNGTEDVRLGYEAEVTVGPTIPFVQSTHSVSAGAGLTWGAEPAEGLILGFQSAVEAQHAIDREEDAPKWADILGEFDGWGYLRPRPGSRHTFVASISAAGGWKSTIPFQLTLGGDTGLRGYPRHLDPGGQRVVVSFEHRARVNWLYADLFDLGTVVFADAGKIWPGQAPFGVESPIRSTVGVGVRAAFPPGSRQIFRADIGVPLRDPDGVRGFVISVGMGQLIGRGLGGRDGQLLRSARYSLTTSDFAPY